MTRVRRTLIGLCMALAAAIGATTLLPEHAFAQPKPGMCGTCQPTGDFLCYGDPSCYWMYWGE